MRSLGAGPVLGVNYIRCDLKVLVTLDVGNLNRRRGHLIFFAVVVTHWETEAGLVQ